VTKAYDTHCSCKRSAGACIFWANQELWTPGIVLHFGAQLPELVAPQIRGGASISSFSAVRIILGRSIG